MNYCCKQVFLACLLLTAYCLLAACGGPGERMKDIEAQKTPAPTATPSEREISGVFNVSGTAANDTEPYNGVLTVAPSGDVYSFRWTTNKGTRVGTGVQLGNMTAASYAATGGGKGCGVALYKIAPDGSMEGKIARWGEKSFDRESATRIEGQGFVGKYAINVSSSPNEGRPFNAGVLTISKDGGGYDFEWKTDKPQVGFGIWKGSVAAASFGGPQCSFALYDIQSNGNMEGNWGGQKSVTFGTESAKRQ